MNESSPSSVPAKSPTFSPLWHSGLHTLGTSIISISLGIAISIIIARALGPTGKGSYDLIIATTALMSTMLGFSLSAGVTYVVARGEASVGSLALRLLLIAPWQGLVAASILFIFQHTSYASALLPPRMGNQAIAAIVISFIFTQLSGYWRATLFGRQKIIEANSFDLISRGIFLIVLLAVIIFLSAQGYQASASIFIWIYVSMTIVTNLVFLRNLYPLLSRGESSGFRELISFAFPCYLGDFAQFFNYRLDVFMVSFFIGVEGVGLYTLAVNLAQLIWLISQSASKVLLPSVAASPEAALENAARTAQITRLMLWVSLVLAISLALCAHIILPIMYGEAFRRSIAPFLWLLPGIVAFSTVNVLFSYMAGIGKPRINLFVALAGLFFTIILDFLLIPRFNIVGAAIASTVSYSMSAALAVWFFRKESGKDIRDILLMTSEDMRLVISLLRRLYQRMRHEKAG